MKQKSNSLFINTKDHCFICLNLIKFSDQNKTASLKILCRYLKVNLSSLKSYCLIGTLLNDLGFVLPPKIKDVEVTLCGTCDKAMSKISDLIQFIELFQMELDYWIGTVKDGIGKSIQEPVKDVYEKKMRDDMTHLLHLELGEKLRQTLSANCSKTADVMPHVKLSRLDPDYIKSMTARKPDDSQAIIEKCVTKTEAMVTSDDDDYAPVCETYWSSSDDNSEDVFEDNSIQPPSKTHASTPNDIQSQGKVLRCNHCPKECSSSLSLIKHFESVHLGIRFNCKFCNKTIADKDNLEDHEKICKLAPEKEEREPIQIASEANGNSQSQKPFQKVKNSSPLPVFKCPRCEKEFNGEGKMRLHFRLVHRDSSFISITPSDSPAPTSTPVDSPKPAAYSSPTSSITPASLISPSPTPSGFLSIDSPEPALPSSAPTIVIRQSLRLRAGIPCPNAKCRQLRFPTHAALKRHIDTFHLGHGSNIYQKRYRPIIPKQARR